MGGRDEDWEGEAVAKHNTSMWGASVTVWKEEEYVDAPPPRKQHVAGGGQRQ